MTLKIAVSPQSPAPWIMPNGQPTYPYYQYQVRLASFASNIQTAGSISPPTGGAVVDVQARAAIKAILAALANA